MDFIWIIYRWFTISWWKYLLKGCTGWRNFWCRVSIHKCGIVYYNPTGLEPDWHCKNCGEDLY
jgi:hypothetical protein